MRQILHLLIVDRERCAALAVWHGSRWLLPVIICGEMTRTAPLAARWCAERGLASDIAGQWLGRVGPDATDWLMAIPARTECPVADATLQWVTLDVLSSGPSGLDYQTWALAASLERCALPSVGGPFGNLDWPEEVRGWIGEVAGSPADAWTPYRVGAHEVVLAADTALGRVYFKGLTADRAGEVAVTRTLAALDPDCFAPTLALERRGDGSLRWLTGECAGRPSRNAPVVAAALARVQQRVIATEKRPLALQTAALESAAQWAGELLHGSACATIVREHCAKALDLRVPDTWIPMDLDPSNVLADDDGAVRFIDVDDSFFGPAPLAMAAFATRCRDVSAYRAYEASWSPALAGIEWGSVEVAATVFQSWLGWNRLKRNIERGEVYAALHMVAVQVRERLARAIYRR